MSGELTKAARLLEEMLASDPPASEKADEIRQIEHACDTMTHNVHQRLHRTFVTPIDREDIHAIAGALDDVVDSIDATAGQVQLYRIETVRPAARELAQIITRSTVELRLAITRLELRKGIGEHLVEVNRLENEADRAHQKALQDLFEEETDPITLIKWKEILDHLETTTDRCEDVADVVAGIVLKQG
jgi:predicted phosphate transport protein (TIGR00153 family)